MGKAAVFEYLHLVRGDITRETTDAIVNAANSALAGGGGVDGAIHRAGGRIISESCREIGGCPTGQAVITPGGNLPARYVIHAVGPIYHDGESGEPELLAGAYRNCFRIAREHQLRSIAFPAISTGVYGYPLPEAARISLQVVLEEMENPGTLREVRFVLFDDRTYGAYRDALAEMVELDLDAEGVAR